jgi:hypothetical protein
MWYDELRLNNRAGFSCILCSDTEMLAVKEGCDCSFLTPYSCVSVKHQSKSLICIE